MLLALATLAIPQVSLASEVPALPLAPRPVLPLVRTIGTGTVGAPGLPRLALDGAPLPGLPFALRVENALPGATGELLVGLHDVPVALPAFGSVLHPSPLLSSVPFVVGPEGTTPPLVARMPVATSAVGRNLVMQARLQDPAALGGTAFTAAMRVRFAEGSGRGPLPLPLTQEEIVASVTEDFDGDGLTDVAFLESFGSLPLPSTRLVVRLGTPDGSFGTEIQRTVSNQPVEVLTAGDVNGDGVVDVVIGDDQVGRLSAFLGTGSGAFPTRVNSFFGDGVQRVTLGHLDADGVLDAVVADFFGEQIHVFLGVGDGSFTFLASYAPTPTAGDQPYDVAIEDINADGTADVVVGLAAARVRVHLGLGAGALDAGVDLAVPGMDAVRVEVLDVDLDGALDLVVGSSGATTLSYLSGNGDGSFGAPIALSALGYPGDIVRADVDGDGAEDFAVDTFSSTTEVWLAAPGGPTRAGIAAGIDGSRGLAGGDVDGDGLVDLVLTSGTDGLVVLRGSGDGAFGPVTHLDAGESSYHGVAVGDFNGDGLADVAIVGDSSGGTLRVFPGGSSPPFPLLPLAVSLSPIFPQPMGVEAVDLDLDGDDDLVAWGNGGLVVLLAQNQTIQSHAVQLAGERPTKLVVGDWNGDRFPDLVVLDGGNQGELDVLLGQGDGTFVESSPVVSTERLFALASADFDQDGLLDLALGTLDGIELIRGLGNGTFAAPTVLTVGRSLELAFADLDTDGLPDLLRHSNQSGAPVAAFLATTPGAYAPGVTLPTPPSVEGPFAVDDLDRDGHLDVVFVTTGAVLVHQGNGDGTFRVPIEFATPGFSTQMLLRDVNQDLLPDLVTLDPLVGAFVQANQTLR